MIIISAYQINPIISNKPAEAKISLDLGQTKSLIRAENDYLIFPDGQKIALVDLKKVQKNDNICFLVEDNQLKKISLFSDKTNKFYKLVPTGASTPPTLEISGIRMHVTKKYSPKEDTEEKISHVKPCVGNVLDTCTGLGYTAILASKTADIVYTFEIDENVIEIEKYNSWSRELFNNQKIKRHHGDIFKEIQKQKSGYFDRIIHDPPRQVLATLLYSQQFYDELFRVLKAGGKIYHYTGDPGSKRGLDIRAGITKRMAISGFSDINRVFNGITAGRK